LCCKYDVSFESLKDATILTEYSVEIRYPDEFYIPDLEEARKAQKMAILVKEFVLEKIKTGL